MKRPLKALTILQPYAELIACGEKRCENRTWATEFVGWVAIHAGKSDRLVREADLRRFPEMDYSAIIAVAWLAGCVTVNRLDAHIKVQPELAWLRNHRHLEGPVAWVFPLVHRLREPIPMRGKLGLWTVTGPAVAHVRMELERHRRDAVPA